MLSKLSNNFISKQRENRERRLEKLEEKVALEGSSVNPKILIEIEDIKCKLDIHALEKDSSTPNKDKDMQKLPTNVILTIVLGLIVVFIGSRVFQLGPCQNGLHVLLDSNSIAICKTNSEISVENVSRNTLSIRISWDSQDSNGIGEGEDSYINDSVEPNKKVTRKIKHHTSVQVWVWDRENNLVESCTLSNGCGNLISD